MLESYEREAVELAAILDTMADGVFVIDPDRNVIRWNRAMERLTGYAADEAYFLHCILDFFEYTLKGHVALKPGELDSWLTERRKQIERTELTYIAHQLDFLGTFN